MMEVFRRAARRAFEDEMVTHLTEFSPPLIKTLGEEQLRNAIDFGIVRAASHGLTYRGPVRLYLELMLLFGSYFDDDPQYPWAGEILSSHDAASQMERADRLYQRTIEYRKITAGPEDIYAF